MKTPIALFIFNRPELTKKVFKIIQKVKPQTMFVISDGPRIEKEMDIVDKTRKIIEQIDWKCDVIKKYSNTNLGCRISVSLGLDWVFSQVEEAIILEDDCIPDLSFFPYCEELLQKYKQNTRIMMISGNNFISYKTQFSYDFSYHSLIWGWATWKRAWRAYSDAEKSGLSYISRNKQALYRIMSSTRINAIEKTLNGSIDTWDFIWQLALLMNNGLCIFPEENLVRNIGFGKEATHTKLKTFHTKLDTKPIAFPIKHPMHITANLDFENKISKTYSISFTLIDLFKQFFR
ncbi:hemolytic protein HlpA-like protein [Candidatus Roizmanbacteria bacterium CG_4_10_14_0_8_um_filter_33_9]|uniref:Hemolytic protein HlpA-like protein n=1 Tax=Candidatus Roizmanbacteria bacterium CG_4_10_14_0_8_um_filter_33_9 TaxID=1974826 RepID=A0A2M7QIY4_9BACT|nr:MAG: hemolytic protein HlpA-like protein [Candidatus Roizmanbacteria bacterium CG_4_10_14_0_8_um_filter_33_9]